MQAFISAIPAHMRMRLNSQPLVEINFLCIHKKLRSRRLGPVLIREITRRVNCEGIFQASYTAGVLLPKPIAKCRYWHRSLNPKKLTEVKFSHIPRGTTLSSLIKKYKVPKVTATVGLRPLKVEDVPGACKLLAGYLSGFKFAPVFNEADFEHWLMPQDKVIYTYVVENDGNITDLISFYSLPSTIVQHPVHNVLNAAYSCVDSSLLLFWRLLANAPDWTRAHKHPHGLRSSPSPAHPVFVGRAMGSLTLAGIITWQHRCRSKT
jgi:glycylpeptide N-tetradecanoyltransferase